MSYLVCHIEKYKKKQIAPIGRHNNRESDKHSNLDIDPELKDLNFYAFTGEEGNPQVNYRKRIDEIMASEYTVNRKPRSDAVFMVGIVVSAEVAYFRAFDIKEIKRFFKCAAEFLASRYGRENVIDAKVHMDETTPHMHYEFVPINNGRLSARSFFDKYKLQELQTEFAKYMNSKSFDIDRGIEASGLKHIPIPELKKETYRAMHDLEMQEQVLKAMVDDVLALLSLLSDKVAIDKCKKLKESVDIFANNHRAMVYESAHYLRKKRELEETIKRLQTEKELMKKRNNSLVDILKVNGLNVK